MCGDLGLTCVAEYRLIRLTYPHLFDGIGRYLIEGGVIRMSALARWGKCFLCVLPHDECPCVMFYAFLPITFVEISPHSIHSSTQSNHPSHENKQAFPLFVGNCASI